MGRSDIDASAAASGEPGERQSVGTWLKSRVVGLVALALVAAGQMAILLTVLFAPADDPESVLDVFETHWTDDLGEWWVRLSFLATGLALLGLLMDNRRDVAAIALGAAFIGFVWPWGI